MKIIEVQNLLIPANKIDAVHLRLKDKENFIPNDLIMIYMEPSWHRINFDDEVDAIECYEYIKNILVQI